MLRIVVRRLAFAVPLVFVVSIVTFVLVAITPGDAAEAILGPTATPAQLAAARRQLGLDLPLYDQYWHWLAKAVRGDLGVSLYSGLPVSTEINSRLGVTLALVLGATLLSAVVGVTIGIASARFGGALARAIDVLAMLGFAIPGFWLALVLMEIFAQKLRWLPATGFTPFSASPLGWLESLVLPVVSLSLIGVTLISKQTRESMLDVLGRDFVVSLRAAGIPEREVVYRYALRNAALPVVTILGLNVVGLLGSTILIEQIFGLPGLGSLIVEAAGDHDLPVMQGIAVYFTLIVVAVNLLVDLLYGWLNPKARAL